MTKHGLDNILINIQPTTKVHIVGVNLEKRTTWKELPELFSFNYFCVDSILDDNVANITLLTDKNSQIKKL